VFLTGQEFKVTIVPPPGFEPTYMYIYSDEAGGAKLTGAPFTATLRIPDDYLGDIVIGAIARDASFKFGFTKSILIRARTAAKLERLSVDNAPVFMSLRYPNSLMVVGFFDDGISRWIHKGELGTTYRSQKPAIATVDADGQLTGHSTGTVVIDIANGDCKVQATVHVSDPR